MRENGERKELSASARVSFCRQIDSADVRSRAERDDAFFAEVVRLAVENYGVNAAVLEKGSRGEIIEAIVQELQSGTSPTLH